MRKQQKPRSFVPADYGRVRLPLAVIFRRIEAGFARRRDHLDAASVYEQRGLLVVGR